MTIYQGDRSGRATLVGRTWGTRCLEGDEKGTRGSHLQDALFLADALVLGTHIIAGRRASPATGAPHPLKLAGVSRLANAAARGYDRTPWAARRGLILWAEALGCGPQFRGMAGVAQSQVNVRAAAGCCRTEPGRNAAECWCIAGGVCAGKRQRSAAKGVVL